MGIRENFTQALKELTGTGKSKDAETKNLPVEELEKVVDAHNAQVDAYGVVRPPEISPDKDNVPDKTPALEELFEVKDEPRAPFAQTFNQKPDDLPVNDEPSAQTGGSGTSDNNADTDNFMKTYAAPAAFAGFRPGNDADDANESTVISRNTVIDGNIRSFADMRIDGDVRGNVETTKNIDLNGKIVGNVTCNNAFMHMAQIQGNVNMKGNINMKRNTLLIGDIMSTYAEINGKIKGNIDIAGKAELKSDAVVFGNISASTITVEDGAIIQGHVSTLSLNEAESKNLFPEIVIGN